MNIKEIIESRDYDKMVGFMDHPIPGEYYITGLIAGNQKDDLIRMVGYIVQVRLKAGAFGSDMILMRCPDGVLARHENQSYFGVSDQIKEEIKKLYTEEVEEDYSQAYTLSGEYPEIGKIIQSKETGMLLDESPLMQITVEHADGSKTIEVC